MSSADIESMSDEEFQKHAQELMNPIEQTEKPTKVEETTPPADEVVEDTPADTETSSNNTETEPNTASEANPNSETTGEKEPAEKSGDTSEQPEDKEVDYKTLYSEIMKPIKANGKTLEIKTPEEAVSLIQKGANYNKKMNELAPQRKILRMLQDNDLLNEEKLSLLIDLDKKDPAAMQKFFQDKQIDPLDVDLTEPSAYNPQKNIVPSERLALDDVLDELKESDTGQQTIDSIFTSWDTASQQRLCENPRMFQYLRDAKANGIYDKVMADIERQKMLGKLPASTSVFDAYTALEAPYLAQPVQKTATPVAVTPPKETVSNPAVDKQIKATQSTRSVASKTGIKKPTTAEIEKMSDEEFQKVKHLFF